MNRFSTLITAVLFGFLALPAFAGGKSGEKASIGFHLEADENDNPKMIARALAGGRERIFRRMPEITLREIDSYKPFAANDGASYGLVLKLKANGAQRLAAITNTNIDRYLLAKVNGRSVDATLIDRQISDGFIVIWSGVTAVDIAELDKVLPHIGDEGKKKKKK